MDEEEDTTDEVQGDDVEEGGEGVSARVHAFLPIYLSYLSDLSNVSDLS